MRGEPTKKRPNADGPAGINVAMQGSSPEKKTTDAEVGRPSNRLEKPLKGERPASRFYDFEPKKKTRTPRPASLQCCVKKPGGRAAREPPSMTLNPKKLADAEAGVPPMLRKKTWRASGPRAVSMISNPKKYRGRRGQRPSNEAYKFDFHNVARFYHRVVQSCHINKIEVFRRQGIRKCEIGGIEKYGVRARCKPQNKRKPHANQPKQPDPFHI